MLSIFRKEIIAFFNSLIAYIVIIIFLTGIGLYMWVFPPNVFEIKTADMSLLFDVAPYVFMFLIPAITMRSFAEEKKTGTLELLLTRPITEWNLLLGKYLACFLLVFLSVVPTLVYYFSISSLGNPPGNLDTPGIMGSYIGLILLGGVYTSIGLFSSSITENQIVAFIVALFISLLLYVGFGYLGAIFEESSNAFFIQRLGLAYHYESLSRGVVDSRNVVYMLSAIAFMLTSTKLVLASRKW